ncbi:MAG: hypothetical protein ACLFPX_07975, partial [Candidatus Omnitrophota bacterium]
MVNSKWLWFIDSRFAILYLPGFFIYSRFAICYSPFKNFKTLKQCCLILLFGQTGDVGNGEIWSGKSPLPGPP